jgi:hypothetical protein
MTSRKLKLEQPVGARTGMRWASDAFAGKGNTTSSSRLPVGIAGAGPELDSAETESSGAGPGEVSLRTFHDAFEVGRACESLEESGVLFRLEDVSEELARRRGDGYATVALNLIVAMTDRERAVGLLRQKMGLFPLQEVTEPDAMVDDGTVSQVAYFGSREEAEFAAEALQRGGIWNRIAPNPEGSVENEDAWVVEVKEMDLVRAGDVVIEAMRAAEG